MASAFAPVAVAAAGDAAALAVSAAFAVTRMAEIVAKISIVWTALRRNLKFILPIKHVLQAPVAENRDGESWPAFTSACSGIRPAAAGLILLLFGDKNSQQYVSILHFENRLLNGREAA